MTAYCISDLHLLPGPNEGFGRFGVFCERLPACTGQLFILGDLVDAWLGDDASLTAYAGVVEIIARLTASGVAVTLLAGNHDFLFGEDFRAATGAALAADPLPIFQAGSSFLLSHGDALCLDDTAYQQIRTRMRSAAWQSEFLASPIEQREAFARQLRDTSQTAAAGKAEQMMDVTQPGLRALHDHYRIPTLIHGHTHRPAVHRDPRNEGFAQRLVMGCWSDGAEIVRIENGQADLLRLEEFLENPG